MISYKPRHQQRGEVLPPMASGCSLPQKLWACAKPSPIPTSCLGDMTGLVSSGPNLENGLSETRGVTKMAKVDWLRNSGSLLFISL